MDIRRNILVFFQFENIHAFMLISICKYIAILLLQYHLTFNDQIKTDILVL